MIMIMSIFHRVSKARQLQLHLTVVQFIVLTFAWPAEMLIRSLERILPTHWLFVTTYQSLFQQVCDRLCSIHRKAPLLIKRNELVQKRYSLEFSEDLDLLFTANYSNLNTDPVTRNEIEKAAEVLSADYHGRLSLMQALTIMCNPDLARAIDRFRRNTNSDFPVAEIKSIANVYYVRGIILSYTRNGSSDNSSRFRKHELE